MTFTAMVEAMGASAIDTLADFDRSVAVAAGLDPKKVGEWEQVHRVYYGPTNASRQQRRAREAARAGGFSLDQLVMIERRVKNIRDAAQRRALRLELLSFGGHGNYALLERKARELAPAEKKPPRDKLTFSRSVASKRSMTVTGDEHDLADLEHYLRTAADECEATSANTEEALPDSVRLQREFFKLMRGNDAQDSEAPESRGGVPHSVPRPLLLIPLPDWIKILNGEGDDTVLGLTDGTTMTGAQFLTRHFATAANHLEAAVFHPAEGPVNLYGAQRFPNDKQRDLLRATTPVCPVPGCKQPADFCQFHHVTAWKNGGATNLNNLSTLCRYHNQINDDDPYDDPYDEVPSTDRGGPRRHIPKKPRNSGRIVVEDGERIWRSPTGFLVRNDHANMKFGAMNALFG